MRNHKNNITLSSKNITSFLKILISHFTEKRKIITLCFIILISSFVNIISNNSIPNTSALSYSSDVNIGFAFNPTLSVSLSANDLIISNLTPGSNSDSNSIDISVATNAAFGYTLSANIGSSDSSSPHYNSSDLILNTNNDNVFSSISTNADLSSLTTDNTWGYTTSLDSGSTWGNYNGLSSSISTTLLDTNTNNTTTGIDTIDFKIGAKASNTQASGAYTNTITFIAITKPTPPTLYENVQSLAKKDSLGNERTQTLEELKATITNPTSTNHEEDTSNSGVYKYDSTLYGEASDASIGYNIYYYRGVLEPSNETHGSGGTATAYPNYVKLANNTCWRIVRTTGSGGVKMIYNGVWDAANNTCANSGDGAVVGQTTFSSNNTRQAVCVGYTYNNNYASNTNIDRTIAELYGTNTNYLGNSTNSAIKNYLENTWYATSMGSNYDDILEPSAGYCNDRTVYSTEYELQDENTAYIAQFSTSTTQYYFGAYVRNMTNSQTPSLTCPRSTVDLYTTPQAANGNKQLSKPVSLLTVDEASFAGSGNNGGVGYANNAYLVSNNILSLLSPLARDASGVTQVGSINYWYLYPSVTYGKSNVRPVISLKPGLLVLSGNGTATSPWTIE